MWGSGSAALARYLSERLDRARAERDRSTGVQPSGNRVRVVSSAWSRFDGDTIREIHFHIDALTLREQVGALDR